MGSSTSKHKTKAYKLHHSQTPEKPLPPGKPKLKYDPENLDPDMVTIKWDPPAFNGGSKITGYLVEHKRTGSPHWVKASPIKVCHTQLTVCGLEPGWRYQFRVMAENEFGLSDPSPLSEPLAIFVHRSAAIAPYFVTEFSDLVVLENEKVEFTVTFEGIPPPKVSWYKDGVEIFSNRCQKISTKGCSSTLLIYEATIDDEAEIKCSVTNCVGHAITKAYLKVEAPPTIRLPRQYEDGLIFETGETVRLKVSVVGKPIPSVLWFLNGIQLVPSLKHEIDYTSQTASLKIKNIQRIDRGEYQIQASNIIGEDLASILVTVANRPEPPVNVKVIRILGPSVTLAWSPPEDDGGCKIGSYIVEYYKSSWDLWLKAITCRQLQVTLDNLIEGSHYKFRVKSENPYGISDPSSETEIIFIPDVKRGILEPSPDDHNNHSPMLESILRLDVPLSDQYQTRSTPTRDQFGMKMNFDRYSGNSQTETDGSSENLDSEIYLPVEPSRKNRRKSKTESSSSNIINLLNVPENDLYLHHSRSPSRILNVHRDQSPSPQPSINVDDASRTSSELMLVLLPSEEDLRNMTAHNITYDLGPHKSGTHASQLPPPPISLSAPELGSEMQFFKPLQRNCVSSTELLHESTIARFYEELKEGDAVLTFKEKCNLPKPQPLVNNFSETSHLLINRLQKNQTKISGKDFSSDVLNDLRQIDDKEECKPLLITNKGKQCDMLSNEGSNWEPPNYKSNLQIPYEKTSALRSSRVSQKLYSDSERSTSHTHLRNALQIPTERCSILNVEPSPQGRYSPRSGTFHYPDLFMESLTKSPKFKTTCGSFSDIVTELIGKRAAAIDNSYSTSQASTIPVHVFSQPNNEIPNCSKEIWTSNRPPLCKSCKTENKSLEGTDEEEDSNKMESEEFEESEEDFDELEDNEADTYHPSDCAPLSFEQALAISNPKRSISPTNDLFLESEAPFYEDEDEPDYGLHYFNRNYVENYANQRTQSFSIHGEEKLLKPILKYNSFEEPTAATNRPGRMVSQEYLRANMQRKDSNSPKKHVRIEEPNKTQNEPQRKNEDSSLVIVNHYSDIVKQFGNVQKSSVKKYMTYDELKAAAHMAEYVSMENIKDGHEDNTFLKNEENKSHGMLQKKHSSEPDVIVIKTKEKTEKVKRRVHFCFDFCVDFFLLVLACWVYCFKDEYLAIPIIFLMVYRQLYDKIKNKNYLNSSFGENKK